MNIPDRTIAIDVDAPVPATDVAIVEDDTCGVLAAPPHLRRYDEHPVQLYSRLHQFTPYPPGCIRRHGNTLYAMVIELENDPHCTPDTVRDTAGRLARHPFVHTAGSIRLQLLGCIHAAMEPKISYSALTPLFNALNRQCQLYLQVPPEHKQIVSKLISM